MTSVYLLTSGSLVTKITSVYLITSRSLVKIKNFPSIFIIETIVSQIQKHTLTS